jgi:hypothetical protein
MKWVVSVTPWPHFTPGNGAPPPLGTHCIGGWVDSELVWTRRLEEECFVFAGDRIPVVQSVVRHWADWVAPVTAIIIRFHFPPVTACPDQYIGLFTVLNIRNKPYSMYELTCRTMRFVKQLCDLLETHYQQHQFPHSEGFLIGLIAKWCSSLW